VVCLEVESAAWGLVARWGCGASAAHEVAAVAAGGVPASILSFTSFTMTSLGMIKSVRFASMDNKNKSINRDNCNDINKENQQQQLTLVSRKSPTSISHVGMLLVLLSSIFHSLFQSPPRENK